MKEMKRERERRPVIEVGYIFAYLSSATSISHGLTMLI
jgi:hypothetical protein